MNKHVTITVENERPFPIRMALGDIWNPLLGVNPPRYALLERLVLNEEEQEVGPHSWVYLCEYMIHLNDGGTTGIEGLVDPEKTRLRLLTAGERLVITAEGLP